MLTPYQSLGWPHHQTQKPIKVYSIFFQSNIALDPRSSIRTFPFQKGSRKFLTQLWMWWPSYLNCSWTTVTTQIDEIWLNISSCKNAKLHSAVNSGLSGAVFHASIVEIKLSSSSTQLSTDLFLLELMYQIIMPFGNDSTKM